MNITDGKTFLLPGKAFYLMALTAFAALAGACFLFVSEKSAVLAQPEVSETQQTGVLQICKQAIGAGLENRIFRFEVAGGVYEAPVGGCTQSITLPVGVVVVTELTDGRFTNQTGTWSGRFRLLDVNSQSFGAVNSVNLSARTAVINVREGGVEDRMIVNFVNTFAINSVIEICKRLSSGDAPTGEVFNFTVDALPNSVFAIPLGQCSGPIQVNVPTTPSGGAQPATVRVTEVGRAGYTLETATTAPSGRFINLALNSGIRNTNACSTIGSNSVPAECVFSNPNGGFVTAQVIEGGATSATTFNFFNSAIPVLISPGAVKICKVAGPGIPEGTRFRFEVRGLIVSDPQPTLGGVRILDVAAGSAAQGGTCEFVRDEGGAVTRFVVDSNVFVQEIGAIDQIPDLGSGEIRVSRIRLNRQLTGFPDPGVVTLPTGGQIRLSPNPNLSTRQAVFTARNTVQEIEFTNFVFRPTLLRICKVAGKGVVQGTPFTFDVTIQNPGGLFSTQPGGIPAMSIPVTLPAGNPKQGGFCAFVPGPFPPTSADPTVGTFPSDTTVTVTERARGASVLALVTSLTGTPTVNLAGRSATLNLGYPFSFNELTFTNTRNPSLNDTRFDFDGDGKTDFSIFRPSAGEWWYMRSSDGSDRAFQFGSSTDRIVPADYTGDGETDIAFFRPTTNEWFVLRSEDNSFFSAVFGAAGDISAPADFDGDGQADLAVFRPSEANWYINHSSGGFTIVQFGASGDVPVPADYDGDERADLAVFRPSTGEWWILRSSDGAARAFRFGSSTDKPVPADYTGDGRTDIAYFRPSTSEWFVLRSEDNSFFSAVFGETGDIPVPGDYDGDGKDDLAVWRPSNANWYVAKSSGGTSQIKFGASGDRPVPAAFIP